MRVKEFFASLGLIIVGIVIFLAILLTVAAQPAEEPELVGGKPVASLACNAGRPT
jgi:hypothetical protein